jgi:hypothetical protein
MVMVRLHHVCQLFKISFFVYYRPIQLNVLAHWINGLLLCWLGGFVSIDSVYCPRGVAIDHQTNLYVPFAPHCSTTSFLKIQTLSIGCWYRYVADWGNK